MKTKTLADLLQTMSRAGLNVSMWTDSFHGFTIRAAAECWTGFRHFDVVIDDAQMIAALWDLMEEYTVHVEEADWNDRTLRTNR